MKNEGLLVQKLLAAVDDLLSASRFGAVNRLIDNYIDRLRKDQSVPSTRRLLAMLTVTAAVKERLLSRETFFIEVKKKLLRDAEKEVNVILDGLE